MKLMHPNTTTLAALARQCGEAFDDPESAQQHSREEGMFIAEELYQQAVARGDLSARSKLFLEPLSGRDGGDDEPRSPWSSLFASRKP